jgi:hypothetical protein
VEEDALSEVDLAVVLGAAREGGEEGMRMGLGRVVGGERIRSRDSIWPVFEVVLPEPEPEGK